MSDCNPDIEKERRACPFNVENLSAVIYGGHDVLRRKKFIENLALTDPGYKSKDPAFMSRDELYDTQMRKNIYAAKKLQEYNFSIQDVFFYLHAVNHFWTNPISLQRDMFVPTIMSQMTDEQREKWLPIALNYSIIGTYAQTEMGHGTFIRAIETTATFDEKTDEFIIDSPTITSTKWWPGSMGKSSNFAVVLAQLHTKGVCRGLSIFLVQIRSLEDHSPMPGITLGDIGPKIGYNGIDNGYLRFNNVRIPRNQMLMRFAQVARDGTYTQSGNARLVYGTMLFVRSMLVLGASRALAQACTVAIRYSAVRRQTEMEPGAGEPQILDYQTQQYKLLPLVATAYGLGITGRVLREIYYRVAEDIQKGATDELPELHALSAGLKAYATTVSAIGAMTCIRSCGGHGYSMMSGIPKIFTAQLAACIFEGENTVMYLQTARYLMKCYAQHKMEGKSLTGTMAYLNTDTSCPADYSSLNSVQRLVTAYERRALRLIERAGERLQLLMSQGRSQADASNLSGVYLVKAAWAHCQYYLVKTYADRTFQPDLTLALRDVLTNLFRLYALHGIFEDSGDFQDIVPCDLLSQWNNDLFAVLSILRKIAVPLVDAFDFPDEILTSVLGRYDGRVYENMIPWAEQSSLNKSQIHDAYYKYQRPLILQNKAKL